MLAEDTCDTVHEITAQTEGERFLPIREKCTRTLDIDGEDIALLEFFEGGFGAEGCGEPSFRDGFGEVGYQITLKPSLRLRMSGE